MRLIGNSLIDAGATINAATVLAKGGDVTFIGNVSGTRSLEIASGATLTLDSVASSGQTLTVHAVDGHIVTLGFGGSYTAANFTSATDGHGGSLISFHS